MAGWIKDYRQELEKVIFGKCRRFIIVFGNGLNIK